MKTKIFYISIIAIITLLLVSCGKEGCKDPAALNYHPDAKKDDGSCEYLEPSLTISKPSQHNFDQGETVSIKATAVSDQTMHGWTLDLVNTSAEPADTVFHKHEHVHSTQFDISEEWTNNVTIHSDMQLTIRVAMDHDGNEMVKIVNFHCHPE